MPFDPHTPGGNARNVLGGPLQSCGDDPPTGFFRDGCCNTGPQDPAMHSVCARMTDEFLKYSLAQGNDLVTPHPEFDFPGLRAGDRWCLCAARWHEAFKAGAAPPVYLAATHEATLTVVPLEELKQHAADVH